MRKHKSASASAVPGFYLVWQDELLHVEYEGAAIGINIAPIFGKQKQ